MASGRSVEYRLKLSSNASSVLNQDTAAANKFDNSMWQVQKTLAAFGVGLGAHFLIDAVKDWTQAAADYEVAMLRIKNASKEGFGLFNETFVNSQVDKFKTKLQETVDAYGNFLFKIKNANLSNDVSNRLFENLGVVGKVGGIPQEQMDATVRNVGILLGEGVLEARHLRQLSYVHPQIVPFLADALGLKSGTKDEFSSLFKQDISDETAQQKLSQLISSGKLTKLGLNSNIIIEAFEKYRQSIESKLPETLDTVQSHLNSLSVTWERFKNSLILDQKPELLNLFQELENGIKWLSDHEEQIVKIGESIFTIVKLYAEWRIALLAMQLPMGIIGFFTKEYAALTTTVGAYTSLLTIESTSVKELASSYAVLNDQLSSHSLRYAELEAQGLIAGKHTSLSPEMTQMMNQRNTEEFITQDIGDKESGTKAAFLPGLGQLASAVIITGYSAFALSQIGGNKDSKGNYDIKWWQMPGIGIKDWFSGLHGSEEHELLWIQQALQNTKKLFTDVKDVHKTDVFEYLMKNSPEQAKWIIDQLPKITRHGQTEPDISNPSLISWLERKGINLQDKEDKSEKTLLKDGIESILAFIHLRTIDEGTHAGASHLSGKHINLPESKHTLRGNSSNYFTVHITGGVNGMVNPVFKEVGEETMKDVKEMIGVEMTRNFLQIINDIQVVKYGH